MVSDFQRAGLRGRLAPTPTGLLHVGHARTFAAAAGLAGSAGLVLRIDDLDGATADETVAFTLDGKQFEIDLNAANAATLRDKLAPFVSAARTAGGNRRAQRRDAATAAGSTEARRHNQAVRVWARENGYSVSARGRIPAEVVEAYRDHDSNTSPSAPEKAAPTKRPQPAQFSG